MVKQLFNFVKEYFILYFLGAHNQFHLGGGKVWVTASPAKASTLALAASSPAALDRKARNNTLKIAAFRNVQNGRASGRALCGIGRYLTRVGLLPRLQQQLIGLLKTSQSLSLSEFLGGKIAIPAINNPIVTVQVIILIAMVAFMKNSEANVAANIMGTMLLTKLLAMSSLPLFVKNPFIPKGRLAYCAAHVKASPKQSTAASPSSAVGGRAESASSPALLTHKLQPTRNHCIAH
ncbi:MAG: hypothetical protein NT066_05630 [Candidatus Omnitrophica bacterium]|nr:hypothetical protein [Candidatus Omnitrophota bacterium]